MGVARVHRALYRELWAEMVAADFDGGDVITINTGVFVPLVAQMGQVHVTVYVESKVGAPVIPKPVVSRLATGLLRVVLSNTAAPGNMATYTVQVQVNHSGQDYPDGTPLVEVLDASGFGALPAPVAGIIRMYVDGTAGNDASNGSSWATAWRTISHTHAMLDAFLDTDPQNVTVLVFMRGDFTVAGETLTFSRDLPMNVRVCFVHPTSQWTEIQTGGIGGVTAPEAGTGLSILPVGGVPVPVPAAGDAGRFIELTDPVTGDAVTTHIVSVDLATPAYVIGNLDAILPAWVTGGGALIRVIEPSMQLSDVATFAPRAANNPNPPAGQSRLNWLFGIRVDGLDVYGDTVGVAGCLIQNAAAKRGPIRYYCTDPSQLCYQQGTMNYLPDDLATEFGIFAGVLPPIVAGAVVGNTSNGVRVFNGAAPQNLAPTHYSCWAGWCGSAGVFVQGAGSMQFIQGYVSWIRSDGNGVALISACEVYHDGGGLPPVRAYDGGRIYAMALMLKETVGGQAAWFYAGPGGEIHMLGSAFYVEAAVPANYPLIGVECHNGLVFGEQYPDSLMAQVNQIRVYAEGIVEFDNPGQTAIDLTTARPGGAGTADIHVDGGKLVVKGHVVKGAVNAQPGPHLAVLGLGRVLQEIAGSLWTLPAGTGNYQNDYGANGAIYQRDGSDIRLGALTGGAALSAGTAVEIRRACRMICDGAGFPGAAALILGAAAAIAWPAVATSDAPELCHISPVTPL